MKHHRFLLLITLLFTFDIGHSQVCGTRSAANYPNMFIADSPGSYFINTKWYIVKDENGNGTNSTEFIQSIINLTKAEFLEHNISLVSECDFTTDDITIIEDQVLFDAELDDAGFCAFTSVCDGNTLNVFLLDDSSGAVRGLSAVPGNMCVAKVGELSHFATVTHEIGHCFGLFHTYHGRPKEVMLSADLEWACDNQGGVVSTFNTRQSCDGTSFNEEMLFEFVDGTNADIAGDYVIDTPADINVDSGNCPDAWECDKELRCSNFLSLLRKKDPNCDKYTPDWNNFMRSTGSNCRDHFTPGQGSRMRGVITQYVDYLILPDEPTPDVPCTRCYDGVDDPCFICTGIPLEDVDITDNTTLSIDFIHGSLNVKSGSTLTINTEVKFTPLSKVVVENGAKLIIATGGKLTKCDDGDLWIGVHVEGSTFGQPDIGGGPQANKSGYLEIRNGGSIEYATIGVRNFTQPMPIIRNDGGLLDIGGGATINDCLIAIKMYRHEGPSRRDHSQIIQATIIGCEIGLQTTGTNGILVENNLFSDGGIGIDAISSSYDVVGNEFYNLTTSVDAKALTPVIQSMRFFGNTVHMEAGDGFIVDAQNNATEMVFANNVFLGSMTGSGIRKLGLNFNLIRRNDFIDVGIGIVDQYTGADFPNLVNDNSFFSNVIGVVADGNNNDVFLTNCMSGIYKDGIRVLEYSSIHEMQSGPALEASMNCFDVGEFKVHSFSSSAYFEYMMEAGTAPTLCGHPGFNGNFDIDESFQTLVINCGSSANLFDSLTLNLINCVIPSDEASRLAMETALINEITRLRNDPSISPRVKRYLIARIQRCLDRLRRNHITALWDEERISDVVAYVSTLNDLIYTSIAAAVLIESGKYQEALSLLGEHSANSDMEQGYIQSQMVYIDYLIDPMGNYPTSEQLDDVYAAGLKNNEYAGFARTIYYFLTDQTVPRPAPDVEGIAFRSSDEVKKDNISIHPNPTSGLFSLNLGQIEPKSLHCTIYTINGQEVTAFKIRTKSSPIDISHLDDGIYLVVIHSEQGIMHSDKIVKI